MRSFMIFARHQILFRRSNKEESDERGMWCVWRYREALEGFWWVNVRERENVEDLGVYWKMILKWVLNRIGGSGLV